jgi:hypothetical protein
MRGERTGTWQVTAEIICNVLLATHHNCMIFCLQLAIHYVLLVFHFGCYNHHNYHITILSTINSPRTICASASCSKERQIFSSFPESPKKNDTTSIPFRTYPVGKILKRKQATILPKICAWRILTYDPELWYYFQFVTYIHRDKYNNLFWLICVVTDFQIVYWVTWKYII